MQNILDRLMLTGDFDTLIFGDKVIIEEPIEKWPLCDILVSFFSRGFPLEKAIQYVLLRRPFCINDLQLQQLLFDRRLVLLILDAIDVPTPYRVIVNRDEGPFISQALQESVSRDFNIDFSSNLFPKEEAIQIDYDTIKVGRKIIRKPFVEKPVDSENHNIYIYYPQAAGGGVRKLFRKV